MTYNPDIHHRRSIRLREYDYSQCGIYFVTICSYDNECPFGEIKNWEMLQNEFGTIVQECWNDISVHFEYVELDEFIVMPNHVHGIIVIHEPVGRGEVSSPSPSKPPNPAVKTNRSSHKATLGKIVAYFKYQSTKKINSIRETSGNSLWQRNYYEHIIRNEKSFHAIGEYIRNNPLKWAEDEENPLRKKKG